jgi:hypothetical protein
MIAHREESLSCCDRVLHFDGGMRVAEQPALTS